MAISIKPARFPLPVSCLATALILAPPAVSADAAPAGPTPRHFHDQCLAVGIQLSAAGAPQEPTKKKQATSQPTDADCLQCHQAHGVEACTSCHQPHAQAPAPAPTATTPLNASFPQPVDRRRYGELDGVTGASGDFYYGEASYLDAEFLMSRVNGLQRVYSWEPGDEADGAVASLEAACRLPEAPSVVNPDPADGQHYRLRSADNQLGVKVVATVNAPAPGQTTGTPNIATFGYGMRREGDSYFVTLEIGRNNSCHNAVDRGLMRFSYYEYDPSSTHKLQRNRGARILGELDYRRSELRATDWKTPLPGLAAGVVFTPGDVDWDKVGACALVVKVVGIIPLG